MSRRDRKKKGTLGRDFAPLYEPILRTEVVRTLELADFKHYIVLTALCKPWLNGAVPLARSVLADFGLTSGDTTSRSIQNLITRGLIVRTRPARPRHAAMYGVCHLPLNEVAMAKVGARDPRNTPSDHRTKISVRSPDRETPYHRTELANMGGNSVRSPDLIPHVSASNSVRSPDTSKNLPCAPGAIGARLGDTVGAGDPTLIALFDRVRAAGASITTNGRTLRIRQFHGELPAALAGELRLRQKEIYQFLMGPSRSLDPRGLDAVETLRGSQVLQ